MTADRATAAKSTMWSVVENAGLTGISLISLVIYTRLLSAGDFGRFAIALAVVEILGVFVSMFFHDALIQRKDISDLHFDTAFTVGLALSVSLTLLCVFGSPLLATIVNDGSTADLLKGMSACFPAMAFGATIVARQRRTLEFRTLAIRSLVGRLVGALGGIALVLLGAGAQGLVAQQVLIHAVGSVVLWVTCRSRPHLRFGAREFKDLLSFGAFSLGALLLNFSTRRLFVVLAGIWLGVQASGYLNLSLRAVDLLWAIAAAAISQVALPLLSGLQSDVVRLRAMFRRATSLVCLIFYAAFVTVGMTARHLVPVVFGKQWSPAAPYVSTLAFLVLLQAPRLLAGPLLTAVGRPREVLKIRAVELLAVLLGVVTSGVPSIWWALGIWVGRECLSFILTTWILSNTLKLGAREQFSGVAAPLACSLVTALVIAALDAALPAALTATPRLFILASVGVTCFFSAAFVVAREQTVELLHLAGAALAARAHPANRVEDLVKPSARRRSLVSSEGVRVD